MPPPPPRPRGSDRGAPAHRKKRSLGHTDQTKCSRLPANRVGHPPTAVHYPPTAAGCTVHNPCPYENTSRQLRIPADGPGQCPSPEAVLNAAALGEDKGLRLGEDKGLLLRLEDSRVAVNTALAAALNRRWAW